MTITSNTKSQKCSRLPANYPTEHKVTTNSIREPATNTIFSSIFLFTYLLYYNLCLNHTLAITTTKVQHCK